MTTFSKKATPLPSPSPSPPPLPIYHLLCSNTLLHKLLSLFFYYPLTYHNPTTSLLLTIHMEGRSDTINTSSSSSSFPPQIHSLVISPCAACKILRRRCVDKCVLAPYFPPNDPLKFTTAHRVFGASNIIKFLQELPEEQRDDAVSSMVYEANARLRDPVYGCAGAICQLQKQVIELQEQLAKAQAEMVNMQCQHSNLMALICMEMAQSTHTMLPHDHQSFDDVSASYQSKTSFMEETNNLGLLLEPLWT